MLIGRSVVKSEITDNSYYLNIYSSGHTSYINTVVKIFTTERIIKLGDFVKVYFSTKNPNRLGEWKNSLSKQINQIVEKEQSQLKFDYEYSVKVCHAIRIYNGLIEKTSIKTEENKLKVADLAIQYILIRTELDLDKTMKIKESINNEFFSTNEIEGVKNISLADLYRSKSIIDKINWHIQNYES